MTPEATAREKIDAMLMAGGWVVQDYAQVDLSAVVRVALREVPLAHGQCDYLLIVKRTPFAFALVKQGMRDCQIEAIAGWRRRWSKWQPGHGRRITAALSGSVALPMRFSLYERTKGHK